MLMLNYENCEFAHFVVTPGSQSFSILPKFNWILSFWDVHWTDLEIDLTGFVFELPWVKWPTIALVMVHFYGPINRPLSVIIVYWPEITRSSGNPSFNVVNWVEFSRIIFPMSHRLWFRGKRPSSAINSAFYREYFDWWPLICTHSK